VEPGIFEMEVREKKNQAFLNKAKTGSRGGSNSRKGVRTPYDYMSRKEKMSLNGEVSSMNVYTTILNWTEWTTKDEGTQKTLLTKWREIYPNSKIIDELSIGRNSKLNSQSYADIVNALGIPKKVRNAPGTRKAKTKTVAVTPQIESQLEFEEPKHETKMQPQNEVTKLLTKGLHLEFNGTYDVESLNRLFTKLQLLVDGEPHKYNISLSLSEKQK
jgi:hypothetical protein